MIVLEIFGYLLLLASGLLMIQGVWALVISLDYAVSVRCKESGNLNNLCNEGRRLLFIPSCDSMMIA